MVSRCSYRFPVNVHPESAMKTQRIQRLLEKNLKAVVQTPGGDQEQIATRRQRMEIKNAVSHGPLPGASRKSLKPSKATAYEADLLKIADEVCQDG